MIRHSLIAGLLLAGIVAVSPALAGSHSEIASHPSKLSFGPLDFEVPEAEPYRHELKNGIPVYVAEDHSLPLVDVSVTLKIGSFLEPADKPGLAGMVGTMMRVGGTNRLDAEAFDERAAFLAANMGAFIGSTRGQATMDCFSGVLDESLDLFFEMMRTPRFQQDRLDNEKTDSIEAMKQRNDRPTSISGREWQWLMRGEQHFTSRYSTEATMKSINRDDLVAFHRDYWRPEHMIIVVSGDVDTKQILKKLNARFAGWEKGDKRVVWPPPAPNYTPKPGVYYVQKDIPQGRVQIGHLGMQRKDWNDPDAYALSVMNDILGGGGFTSRITKRIRSDEGLAYSAGSSFGVGQYWPGTFSVFYQSKSPTVAYAAAIALEEIEKMRNGKVTDEELRTSKNSLIDSFPRRFESASQIAGTYANDEFSDRPHDYWKSYRDRVRAVTAADVQRVAKKYLDPSQLVFLIVGDWETIQPGDPEGRASMAQFHGGAANELPLRDPLTLKPIEGEGAGSAQRK